MLLVASVPCIVHTDGDAMQLTDEDKRLLLSVARDSIDRAVHGKEQTTIDVDRPALQARSGVFVTLEMHHELRGCIGYIEPVLPLIEATREVAVKAALEDPRFYPVTANEIRGLEIEISVLSPLREVSSIEEIEVGTHGLVLESGFNRGLLLPQVATEYGWDRTEFLDHTARKAGLSPDAWRRKGVRLFTFTVDKFSEAELLHDQPEAS